MKEGEKDKSWGIQEIVVECGKKDYTWKKEGNNNEREIYERQRNRKLVSRKREKRQRKERKKSRVSEYVCVFVCEREREREKWLMMEARKENIEIESEKYEKE